MGMSEIDRMWVSKALEAYDLRNMKVQKLNEDGDVFLVSTPGGEKRFLKILSSKDGTDYLKDENVYHSWPQLCCEMDILAALEKISFGTACPLKNLQQDYVSRLGQVEDAEVFATLTTFVDGTLIEEAQDDPLEMAYAAGAAAGKLHNASQNGLASIAIHRPHRRQAYLLRVMEQIRQGVTRYATVTQAQFSILQQGAEWILGCMQELDLDVGRNLGLVHTDLRAGNFLYRSGSAIPVDFTRSVYGYHLYDLGEMCAHMGGMAPHGAAQKQILLGYHRMRPFRKGEVLKVQAFFVMFLLILVAESNHAVGNPWLLDTVSKLCEVYIPGLLVGGHFDASVRSAIREIED